MKVGISTASLFLRKYNEDALPIIESLGADVAEIFLESFCEYTEDYANILKSRLGSLKIHSIHSLNTHYEPELFSKNDRSYGDAEKIFRNVLRVAEILDAKYNTFHGRIRIKRANYSNYEETGERFNSLLSIASNYGVEICLENVQWAMYSEAGYFDKLKHFTKQLKSCLDIKQARLSGYDYTEYLNEMSDRLRTVHISDYDCDGKVLLPGKGLFNFEKFIGELNAANFDGALIIEVYKDSYKSFDELGESLNYIKKLLKRG